MSALAPNIPTSKRPPRLTSRLRALLGPDWRVKRGGGVRIHLDYREGQHCPFVVEGLCVWFVYDGRADERAAIAERDGIGALVACLRAIVGEPVPG